MITLNVANDFSTTPGARTGSWSGEDFRDILLLNAFRSAVDRGTVLRVVLDGGMGYAASFLEESFGGLARVTKGEFSVETILRHLEIVSEEEPDLIQDIEEYIRDSR